jgi:hypothetical protein
VTDELVEAVKTYAREHYEDGGWDFVVEAYEDGEIAEAIKGCRTAKGAIKRMAEIVGVYDDRRTGAQADIW